MTPNQRYDFVPLNRRRKTDFAPFWHDLIIAASVLIIAVCLGLCYVMIVSKVHGY